MIISETWIILPGYSKVNHGVSKDSSLETRKKWLAWIHKQHQTISLLSDSILTPLEQRFNHLL